MVNTLEIIQSLITDQNEDYHYAAETLAVIINAYHDIDDFVEADNRQELLDTLKTIIDGGNDFYLEFDGNEYRLISDYSIWQIYVDAIQNIVEDCYSDVIKLDKIPSFIAVSIDWEQTAQNAFAYGYGHTFAGYDGEERFVNNTWIFRTN